MAFLLPRRPLLLGLGLATTSLFLSPLSPIRRPLLLDASPVAHPRDWSFSQYQRDASVPITTSRGGLNPRAVRQVSAGSITGVIAGLAVSTFSKPLALLLGLLVFGLQALESRGIHVVPYGWIQRYFSSVDVRSLVQDNAAFKLSFGATFALVGFLDF
ncbi:hypothetical protein K461DRAFT_318174 [Myriangium duriaei CBS 260.36]|uniref:FUN14 family protein n=1 Tax=Myriangium duriaei CBS 260.36 TaxID=1168546 RepID=A0A9P4JFR5_9PEZI|nr:hypothetical protein K461DRAFT_318174 [Myriangium duriaei CBS 260.36]